MQCWFPVSEVAPQSNGYQALVTARRPKGLVAGDAFVTVQTTATWIQGRWVTNHDGDEVTHWMPLPDTPTLAD